MSPPRPVVVFSLLGTQLDAGKGPARWERWRPNVSLFDRDDVPFVRLELVHDTRATSLAQTVAEDARSLQPGLEVRRHVLDLVDPWDFEEVYGKLHDLATSLAWRPDEEELWVHITTGTHVAQICLFLLAESRELPGRLVQTSPRGTPSKLSIVDLDLARYDRIASRFAARRGEAEGILKAGVPTRNERFNRTIQALETVVDASTAPILLTGPTGAGKSRLARQIYALRRARHRVAGSLVEVNCATLRGDGAMSALFGHSRGAFTGAVEPRGGLLREADGGMLFLDEIGDLGLDEQAMLLRAIEDGRFRPLGADREVESRFQLVSGTHRGLDEAVREGRFRADLLARINLWTFELPGLADRLEDVEPNLDAELAAQSGRRARVSKEARAAWLAFATGPEARWTGNFRDLSASVTRMATLAPGGRIDEATVADEIARLRRAWLGSEVDVVAEVLGDTPLDRFDRVQLAEVVRVCRGAATISEAGRRLFAVSRESRASVNDADRLRKYLARFGLTFEGVVSGGR